jgi:hypothetical protein
MYLSGSTDRFRTITSDATADANDKTVLVDSSGGGTVTLFVDVTKIPDQLNIVRISKEGDGEVFFQAISVQTINDIADPIPIVPKFGSSIIGYIGGTAASIRAFST